jgi:hypothetical protein
MLVESFAWFSNLLCRFCLSSRADFDRTSSGHIFGIRGVVAVQDFAISGKGPGRLRLRAQVCGPCHRRVKLKSGSSFTRTGLHVHASQDSKYVNGFQVACRQKAPPKFHFMEPLKETTFAMKKPDVETSLVVRGTGRL